MTLRAVEQLLKENMGLHSSTVGSSTVERAVERRMRVHGITAVSEYREMLSHCEDELNALIDTVVVPETWFYRDRIPFSAFTDWIRNTWTPRKPRTTLRILSIPCSTGEEPYTLAMCLSDCGVPANAARIDAIDISNVSLEKARTGEYGSNSFRGDNLLYRDKYFEPIDARFRLKPEIRQRVHFARGNILEPTFKENRNSYDVIFCRNLLIYFDRPTQHRVVDRLETLLAPEGLLFLGHSETSLILQREFTPLKHPRCFGFSRGRTHRRPTRPAARQTNRRPAPQHAAPREHKLKATPAPVLQSRSIGANAAATQGHAERLQRAFRLADQGQFDEAIQLCEKLVAEQACQADVFYLLGLIGEATGDMQKAEQMFRKVVYLDPQHYQALTHLSAICEQKGDSQNAQRFRTRAARAHQRTGTGETSQ
jgi:chemotaxis protein methyltransferase WspC